MHFATDPHWQPDGGGTEVHSVGTNGGALQGGWGDGQVAHDELAIRVPRLSCQALGEGPVQTRAPPEDRAGPGSGPGCS